jgi:hypothetical protein
MAEPNDAGSFDGHVPDHSRGNNADVGEGGNQGCQRRPSAKQPTMRHDTPPHVEQDQGNGRNVGGGQRLRLSGIPDAPATTGEKAAHKVKHRTPADPVVYRIVRTPTEDTPTQVRTSQDPGNGGRKR